MIKNNNQHYALKVSGESMINAGILDGDTVVIQRAETARHGEIVVALINQQEATLRVRQRLLTGEVVPIDKRPSNQWDYMFKQEIPASKTAPDEESLVDTALKFMTD